MSMISAVSFIFNLQLWGMMDVCTLSGPKPKFVRITQIILGNF